MIKRIALAVSLFFLFSIGNCAIIEGYSADTLEGYKITGAAPLPDLPVTTNLIPYSEVYSWSWWFKANVASLDGSVTPVPGGNTTANGIIGNNSNDTHGVINLSHRTPLTPGLNYTQSFFCKAGDKGWAYMEMKFYTAVSGGSVVETIYAYYNLGTGAVGTTSGVDASGVVDYGGGWYRVWFARTAQAGTNAAYSLLYGAEANGDKIYAGNSSDINISIAGAQINNGAEIGAYDQNP